MVGARAWRRSFASESFENYPNNEALHARLPSLMRSLLAQALGQEMCRSAFALGALLDCATPTVGRMRTGFRVSMKQDAGSTISLS